MNTWGKRPYSSLPETGSFEELTVKKLKFGDCPVSLPTDCPPINGSALAFDTNGIGRWSSGPPAAVQDRIQDAANTCSVVCSAAGDVTMTGAGGEYVKCFGDEISLANGQTQIILFQYGVVMGGPDGEIMYTDSSTTRLNGPNGAAQVALKGDEVEIIAPGLQLLLPGSAANKVLTCLDDTGVAEWREPAAAQGIEDPDNVLSRVRCEQNNIYIEPGADLSVNLPSGNGADKVLTCVDDDGFVEWRALAIAQRIEDPADANSSVLCLNNNIYIQPTADLQLLLPSSGTNKVLTCVDDDGVAEWRDPAPAAIPSRIQDLGGAVVECISGNIDVIPAASKQVTIGVSAVATSKITLQSAALQVSIPSVGTNKVLTSVDATGNAEWRSLPAVIAPDRITNASGSIQVVCNSNDTLQITVPTPIPGRVLSCMDGTGLCQWQPTLGFTAVFGGLANNLTLRSTLQFNGNSTTSLTSITVGSNGSGFVVPVACVVHRYTFDMTAGSATTEFQAYKNAVSFSTFLPQTLGRRGVRPLPPLQTAFAPGDLINIRWTAGTAPDNTVIALYFLPFAGAI